jgi:hypothetical protein
MPQRAIVKRPFPPAISGTQVSDASVQAHHLRIVGLWNIDARRLVDRNHKVENIHRIEINLFAQIDREIDLTYVDLGRNLPQLSHHECSYFFFVHSFSGSRKRRSKAARKRPPR